MTQIKQHTHNGMSTSQFTGARVFHQKRSPFDVSSVVPSYMPEFPCDFVPFPVAKVQSDDLGTIFRLTQLPSVLKKSERSLVEWSNYYGDPAHRSTGYGDVVVLDYGPYHNVYRVEVGSFRKLFCNMRVEAV